jgi:protein TonB
MNVAASRHRDALRGDAALRNGLLLSATFHAAVVVGAVLWGLQDEPMRPPVYRVEMLAAPKGSVRTGVVSSAPPKETPKKAEAPSGAERAPEETAPSTKKAPAPSAKATPTPVKSKSAGEKSAAVASKPAAAPQAGSREGGKGADVRNLRTDGIDFPFPGYLTNIVRQLTLAYSWKSGDQSLVTEVKFVIRRDGTVSEIEAVKGSGNRLFDLDAQATVEQVGTARSFGRLPAGWADDVLVVYFTFDYSLRPNR